jgi:hypothetical protein
VLLSEQRRSDFLPRESGGQRGGQHDALSFDRPTAACLLGTALLSALRSAASDTLQGANRSQFLAEVCVRV